ncbi:cardiolipin synthase (CMP-forming), mitochondrial-like [Macadamia integrifolia]|uniref:cardiolipin synthase (CMP-forming), mitochondrial-like n=1 Tax=Macadamia integrifolia TaxID=60698 RepID=UPI001C532940|nr:cardiolipin synthase (CMP-forming), mitochondrial-like [Macadamia integrifolia]
MAEIIKTRKLKEGELSTSGHFVRLRLQRLPLTHLPRSLRYSELMVGATLVLLCTRPLEVSMFGEVPWVLTVPSIAIIGREITMSAVREWAASQNSKVLEAVAVNNLGKWKTATQMIALTVLLATRDSSLTGSGILAPSGVILLYISAGLAVWSLAVYVRKIWRVLPNLKTQLFSWWRTGRKVYPLNYCKIF